MVWTKSLHQILLDNMQVNVVKVVFLFCVEYELVVTRVEKVAGEHGFMGCTFKKNVQFGVSDGQGVGIFIGDPILWCQEVDN